MEMSGFEICSFGTKAPRAADAWGKKGGCWSFDFRNRGSVFMDHGLKFGRNGLHFGVYIELGCGELESSNTTRTAEGDWDQGLDVEF
jgi:hypothetical protein